MTAPGSAREPAPRSWSLSARDVLGSVVALALVAIAQPLLDLVGRNATFLVAHDAGAADVVAVAVALPIVLPLAVGAGVLLLGRVHPAVAAAAHSVLLALLGAILVLVVLRVGGMADALPGTLTAALAGALGVLVPIAYGLSATFRRVVSVAALAAPVVAALFVFATPARALVFPTSVAAPLPGVGDDPPPIVFLIFDELPIASLLTPAGDVDANAFPAFAQLVGDAMFFRNATTVHGQTSDAVPAALDGGYPESEKLPIAADHPDNLLALLSSRYDLHVVEPLTDLCPPTVCVRAHEEPLIERYTTLARDLAVVGSHLILPPDLAEGLPAIDQGWRDFRTHAGEGGGKEQVMHERFHAVRAHHPTDGFDEFVAGIAPRERPTLHFLHVLLPHSPWLYLPDGREYAREWDWPGLSRGRWTTDEWRVAQTQQRHMLQLQLADRMLGAVLDRLRDTGMYDDALIVTMADHGASFTPGTSLRVLERETFGEIAAVPLIFKLPQQRKGAVADRPAETVDIMPTVLDILDARQPDDIDGRSLIDPDAQRRTQKLFFHPSGPMTFPPDGEEKWPAVRRKHSWFSASDAFAFPFGIAPRGHGPLLGTPVPSDAPTHPDAQIALEQPEVYADVDLSAQVLPVYVQGSVEGTLEHTTPALAVGVNGVIAAVTLIENDPDMQRFRAMIPPSTLRNGANDVTFWLVDGTQLIRLPSPTDDRAAG